MRLVPASLFGRSLLVLAAGLLAAQAATLVLNLFDRGSSVYRLAAVQIAARIAQNARILNRLPAAERQKVVETVDGRHLRVFLSDRPVPVAEHVEEHSSYARSFQDILRRQIGAPWPLRVAISSQPRTRLAPGDGAAATPFELWLARNFYFLLPNAYSLIVQVGLEDGSYAVFSAVVPQEPLSRLESLVPQLLLLALACFALAGLFGYMMARPLQRLARAADAAGAGLDGPPLEAAGPSEIRPVIDAFNRMRQRLRQHLEDRTRLLGAISHDLRTPITRLRLRTELLADRDAAARMQRDLDEMEAMVGSTLEFFRGLDAEPERRPIDVRALVESIAEDRRDMGQAVTTGAAAAAPYLGQPQALRRSVENLVENAVRYGGSAAITVEDSPARLTIRVSDRGPGIPEADLQRVFEPYVRLDASRNLASGGIGLGLSIARNIARWHGGDITLRNAPGGGLVASIELPR
ncbi:MAG TPA: ATP-binding protein [Burkholderiales bacterium]|nr:ATP-binding protein [Burkholderiales bacterium]